MVISLIKIGNSKGIRLPENIIEQYHLKDELEIELTENEIILKPVEHQARKGWDIAFKKMHTAGDDKLLIEVMDNAQR